MNDLCADIGYKSINHYGEQLCGDHVDVVDESDDSAVVVLADGLGSGVKASILSTLTSKIISTMLAEGLPISECVATIAATLPVDQHRGVAYSTFTILHVIESREMEIIQFDNPQVIMMRDGFNYSYPKKEMIMDGKKILYSKIRLHENDLFVAMSDGCPHAGMGISYNFGWQRKDIITYVETICSVGYTAKTMADMLVEECNSLYGNHPGDDATACFVKIRKRTPVNLMFGPPEHRDDSTRMNALFFGKEGKHIVCGGTTASIAAKFLNKPLKATLNFEAPDIPPISTLEGVDLVTEGVVTIAKVVQYAKNYLEDNSLFSEWGYRRDGASLIARVLFEEATDINFYVGRAMNPAHQNPDLPINFNIKMNLVSELTDCLKKMGKKVKVSYF